jgi:mRNA-degrading endonuclease toxin of MazEF toxin-antitoxin module
LHTSSLRKVGGSECGDICLISLDPTQGDEQKGRRPVIIVSPGALNRLTHVSIVLPITTGGDFARVRGFTVSLVNAGTRTTGVIRCDQPRSRPQGVRWPKTRVVNDHLVSEPAKSMNLADPDVAALAQQLIDTADDLAGRGSGG